MAAAAKAIEGADVVVGFGGYVSAPAYLAARRLGVPIVVHEANARPGVANRLGARFTDDVAVTFPGTPLGRRGGKAPRSSACRCGSRSPSSTARAQRETARVALNLDSGRPTLLVTGGSLGAQKLNDTFGAAAPALLDAGVQVLHAAGQGKEVPLPDSARSRPYGLPRYEVVEYLERMDLAYAAADLIVCRAGAGSVAEAAAVGLPACFVPLPIGNGEQRFNAAPVVEAGGALMVDNEDVHAGVGRRHGGAAARGRPAADRDGPRRRGVRHPGRRRAAGRDRGAGRPAAAWSRDAGPHQRRCRPAAELGRVHFVGIGGAGMSGIARILLARDVPVSGSDAKDSAVLAALRALGAEVHVGHDAAHLADLAPGDTVVVSTRGPRVEPRARGPRGRRGCGCCTGRRRWPRVMAGRRGGRRRRHARQDDDDRDGDGRAAALRRGPVVRDRRRADRGRRRTRTTAAATSSWPRPTSPTGPSCSTARWWRSSRTSSPTTSTTTGRRRRSRPRSTRSATASSPGGVIVACADDPGAARMVTRARERRAGDVTVLTYGVAEGADTSVEIGADGTLQLSGGPVTARLRLQVPGRHNALNAAAAWTAVVALGFDGGVAAEGLAGFTGTRRRFETRGVAGGVAVVDDYAHHPTEVAAVLRAARDVVNGGRVLAVFQPHLYSRTRIFGAEFGAALGLADEVVVMDVYAAREDPEPGVSGRLVAAAVAAAARARGLRAVVVRGRRGGGRARAAG